MATDIERIEDIYERLYEISSQITELLERELYEELGKYFQKKEQLLSESSQIIEQMKEKTASEKLKDIVEKYQKQEQKNLETLSKIKEDTRIELSKTSMNSKLVGAYRTNRESIHGNILDFFE